MNTIVLSTTNHSEIRLMFANLAILGAPHSTKPSFFNPHREQTNDSWDEAPQKKHLAGPQRLPSSRIEHPAICRSCPVKTGGFPWFPIVFLERDQHQQPIAPDDGNPWNDAARNRVAKRRKQVLDLLNSFFLIS